MDDWTVLDLDRWNAYQNQSHQYAKKTQHSAVERWAGTPFVSKPSLQFMVCT